MRGPNGRKLGKGKGMARWAPLPALVAVVVMATAAAGTVWSFDPPSEELPLSDQEISSRKAIHGYSDGEAEPPPEEKARVAELAKAERQFVESHSPAALYEATEASAEILPPVLRSIGLDSLTNDVFPEMRLAESRADSEFEEAYLTDGSAELLVSWQVWPRDLDASIAIPPGSEVTVLPDGSKLAITEADLLKIQTTEARFYDGTYLVSVVLIDDEPGEIEVIKNLGAEVLERIHHAR